MYKYIVSSLIIVVILIVYFILLSKGIIPIKERFFSKEITELKGCKDCNRTGKKGMNKCLSCNNCGWCIDSNDNGSCVLGNSNGPLFAECAQYKYNGGISVAIPNRYIGNTFDNNSDDNTRQWRPRGDFR